MIASIPDDMYFAVVHGSILIEPTESESKQASPIYGALRFLAHEPARQRKRGSNSADAGPAPPPLEPSRPRAARGAPPGASSSGVVHSRAR